MSAGGGGWEEEKFIHQTPPNIEKVRKSSNAALSIQFAAPPHNFELGAELCMPPRVLDVGNLPTQLSPAAAHILPLARKVQLTPTDFNETYYNILN